MIDDVDEGANGGIVASLPLPKDHWVYEPTSEPPAPLADMGGLERDRMTRAVWAAGKYAVRGATMSGRSPNFDPDTLIQALIVGLLRYARPEAQLLGTEGPTPANSRVEPHSPKSVGGYLDPEKPEMGLEQGDVAAEKGTQP